MWNPCSTTWWQNLAADLSSLILVGKDMNLHIQSTLAIKVLLKSQPLCWRCDTLYDDLQHNDTQHNDTQKTQKTCHSQHNDTSYWVSHFFIFMLCVVTPNNVVMLSVVVPLFFISNLQIFLFVFGHDFFFKLVTPYDSTNKLFTPVINSLLH
jgi:hypothetical protein